MTKRAWLYFCVAAFLAEACSTWVQSLDHATDVPFAVTYTTRAEYATARLTGWAAFFVPFMAMTALLLRRKEN